MRFFQKTIKIILTLLASFSMQNFKKSLVWNPDLWPCVIFGPEIPHLPQRFFFFFQKKPYNFHAPVSPFHCKNFSKNPWSWSRVLSMHHLQDQNGLLAQTEFFLQKVTTYSWSIYFLQSLCKIWRKSFEQLKRRLKICTFYLPSTLTP